MITIVAMILSMASNGVVLRRAAFFPDGPIPRVGVALQILSNVCWVFHASSTRQYFLCAAASTSGIVQITSLYLLHRRRKQQRITDSTTTLPSLPPLVPSPSTPTPPTFRSDSHRV